MRHIMGARRHHPLSVLAFAFALVVPGIILSGCISPGGSGGSPTMAPSSPSAAPAPASLYLDPPVPGVTPADVIQPSTLPEPAARVPFADPAFGTRMIRVSDREADLLPGDASEGLKNEHSRVQAFNSDGSRFILQGTGASWYLYNGTTLLPEGRLPFDGAVEPRWDAVSPGVLYYVDGPLLMRYDLAAQVRTTVHDFSSQFRPHAPAQVWTRSEGSPSQDNRYWGLMAQGQMGKVFAFIIYDLVEDRIVARRDITPTGGVDGVTISPRGDYFLAYFEPLPGGKTGSDATPGGLMVYDKDLKNGRCLARAVGHFDLAFDEQGSEVLVYQDVDNDTISMCDLATGTVTRLFPVNYSRNAIGLHFSGRAFWVPGWALVSACDSDPDSSSWMNNQVFAIELKPDGRVVRLAHARSLAQPRATVDRNFTRVLFTSNWGRPDAAVDTYMIVLPPGWTGRLA